MDNLDILFGISLTLCFLGGVCKFISWYTKKNTTPLVTKSLSSSQFGESYFSDTAHGKATNALEAPQTFVFPKLSLPLPETENSALVDFFAGPLFEVIGDIFLGFGGLFAVAHLAMVFSVGFNSASIRPQGVPQPPVIYRTGVNDPLGPFSRVLTPPQKNNAIVRGLILQCLQTPDLRLYREVLSLLNAYRLVGDIPTLIDALSKKLGVSKVTMTGALGEPCGSVIIPGRPHNSRLDHPETHYGPLLPGTPVGGKHRPPTPNSTPQEDRAFLQQRRDAEFSQNRRNTPTDERRNTN